MEQAIELIAKYLIENKEVEWTLVPDILDYGDDGDGYVAKAIETPEILSMPDVFVEEEYQDLLEEKVLEQINTII